MIVAMIVNDPAVTEMHIQQPYQVISCILLVYQDYEYSHDAEEHFEDADGDEDFKSVQDDLEIRHAEGVSPEELAACRILVRTT